jgi:hypothetical protein
MFVFSGTNILHFLRFPVERVIFLIQHEEIQNQEKCILSIKCIPLHKYFTTDRIIEMFKV